MTVKEFRTELAALRKKLRETGKIPFAARSQALVALAEADRVLSQAEKH
jgi:hypothetical protein